MKIMEIIIIRAQRGSNVNSFEIVLGFSILFVPSPVVSLLVSISLIYGQFNEQSFAIIILLNELYSCSYGDFRRSLSWPKLIVCFILQLFVHTSRQFVNYTSLS